MTYGRGTHLGEAFAVAEARIFRCVTAVSTRVRAFVDHVSTSRHNNVMGRVAEEQKVTGPLTTGARMASLLLVGSRARNAVAASFGAM